VRVQVKIWFQNHRYKTKKAQNDQSNADHTAPDPSADRALSTRKPLISKDGKKRSTEDDDDWKNPSTAGVLPSDRQDLPLPTSASLGFRSSAADDLGYPTSMYVGGSQSLASSMFLQTSSSMPGFQLSVDEYRTRLQQAAAARPCNGSPIDSAPSPFPGDVGLSSVLYGPYDTVTNRIGGSMGYYHSAYASAVDNTGRTFDRSIASPTGYTPVSSLRTW